MKKLYKIPGGPELVVETEMKLWEGASYLVGCWLNSDRVMFPAPIYRLHDIEPVWHPPVEFAPEWARWAAFSGNGKAYWYECEPIMSDVFRVGSGRSMGIGVVPKSIRHLWRQSLVEVNRDSE